MKNEYPQKLILIAENELYTAGLLQFHLRRAGYQTISTRNGDATMDLLHARLPDLLILDSMLPNLEGYQVCALAKEAPETCQIPVMVLMPRPAIEDDPGDFILGADDYLVRPFEPRELIARVTALVQPRHKPALPHAGFAFTPRELIGEEV